MKVLWVVGPLVLALGAACGRSGPGKTAGAGADTQAVRPGVELGAAAQLDSGNVAYRGKDYAGALQHYRQAADRQPRLAAAWFGVYMAELAQGHKAAADSALRKAQSLDPGMTGGHPTAESGAASALPPGHPGGGPSALPPGHPVLPTK